MKSSKTKGLWLIAMLVLSQYQMSYATVIDPSNLAQNIIQVIQQKIESKLTGDQKEIANSQLKTESQTTADIIGMNSSVKTNLNLDLATFNYENTPSSIYKSYYKSLDIREKNYALLIHLQKVKSYYESYIIGLLSPQRNKAYVGRFNSITLAIHETDLLYSPFTNTIDNGGSLGSSLTETGGSHNSSVSTSTSLDAQANTRELQKAYDKQVNGLTTQISDIEKARADLKQKLEDEGVSLSDFTALGGFSGPINLISSLFGGGKAKEYAQLYNELTAKSTSLQDQLTDLQYDFQSQMAGAIESATGGLGGIFGSNTNEKGRGQRIEIDAPMGRMGDADRVKYATEAYKNFETIEVQITRLENELRAIKSDYDLKKYVDETKFSASGFYDASGAMDYQKMMNFDKE